jgi:two-component sensor histidine kinase
MLRVAVGDWNANSADHMTDVSESRRLDLEQLVADRTRELTQALEQKTALLHEVDHRVKNNLQLISSLLLLQNRRVSDPGVKAAMRAMLDRVNAIATVHRRLFQSDDVERFDVSAFVRDLVSRRDRLVPGATTSSSASIWSGSTWPPPRPRPWPW